MPELSPPQNIIQLMALQAFIKGFITMEEHIRIKRKIREGSPLDKIGYDLIDKICK